MSKKKIEDCIRDSLEQYFKDLRGTEPNAVHDMVIGTVEKPMLEVVMKHADGNQSKAAEWLGINRNTLRRKLLDHKILKHPQQRLRRRPLGGRARTGKVQWTLPAWRGAGLQSPARPARHASGPAEPVPRRLLAKPDHPHPSQDLP